MHIIMTGATSFVGAASAREALRRGYRVTAVVRPGTARLEALTGGNEQALEEKRLLIVENDLSRPAKLPGKIPDGGDVFCHFGWGGSGSGSRMDEKLQKDNLRYSLGAVEAAKQLGCGRFLFTGSQAEYGLHAELTDENAACLPRSTYGAAKLEMRRRGEELCRALGMEYVHVRIFSAYGPGDHPWTLVESCLDAFLGGRTIALGACTQQWNFLHIGDLAAGICALCGMPAGTYVEMKNPVFNLAGGETRVLREFVEEIYAACERNGGYTYGARRENAEGLVNLIPDIAKLTRTTGWKPEICFADGIRAMAKERKIESFD